MRPSPFGPHLAPGKVVHRATPAIYYLAGALLFAPRLFEPIVIAKRVPPNQADQLLCYRLRRVTVFWQRSPWLVQASKRVESFIPVGRAWGGSEPLKRVLERGYNAAGTDRKSTRLNSSHANISYAVFCLKK